MTRNFIAGRLAVSLALLSFAAGCTDVLTFLELGDVFTSAMTGNTALLAIAIGRGEMAAASRAFTALLGFLLGVAMATALGEIAGAEERDPRSLRRLLALEIVFLFGCALLWQASGDAVPRGALYVIILLSAVSMGIQGVTARHLNASGINTIVFTSALVTLVSALCRALGRSRAAALSPGMREHLGAFAAYALGAATAGALLSYVLVPVIWLPLAAVLAAFGCTFFTRHFERSAP